MSAKDYNNFSTELQFKCCDGRENMNNMDRIKILIAALFLASLAGTGAAVRLSNSGGGTWKYQRDNYKENNIELV